MAPLETTYDIERKRRSVAMQPNIELVHVELAVSRTEALSILDFAREVTSKRYAA